MELRKGIWRNTGLGQGGAKHPITLIGASNTTLHEPVQGSPVRALRIAFLLWATDVQMTSDHEVQIVHKEQAVANAFSTTGIKMSPVSEIAWGS